MFGKTNSGPQEQQGVVLLEALIAILIFSIGILGMVGMLTVSTSMVSEAQYRSEAAFWVDSLIGGMRVAAPDSRNSDFASPTGSSYTDWKNRLTCTGYDDCLALPGAKDAPPTIVFNNDQVTVTVFWQQPGESVFHQHIVTTALEGQP